MHAPLSRRQFAIGLGVTSLIFTLPISAGVQSSSPRATIPQPSTERALDIISPALIETEARRVLHPGAWEHIHGGTGSGWTLAANRTALDDISFKPHRLADFAEADTRARLIGVDILAPIYVCPMGTQDFAHKDAELASVRGARSARVPYMLSSASNRSLEKVALAASTDLMLIFAIYLNDDPKVNRALARQASTAGYGALVMTVDSLGTGTSDAYLAMGSPRTAAAAVGNFDPARGGIGDFSRLKRAFTPSDIRSLKDASDLPVFVKGILRADDAVRAVASGADGIVVSNHGGCMLDGALPAIDALLSVVQSRRRSGAHPVRQRGPSWKRRRASPGARSGSRGIGRPVLDATAVGRASGAGSMLDWFRKDLATQLVQVGARTPGDLSADLRDCPNLPTSKKTGRRVWQSQ